ncbi:MAG: oxidoreductase [Chloroflexi bacterium]|nr:MAG: oxidoreductase [Chloroflexota bacterium]
MSSNGHVLASAGGTFELGGDLTINRMGFGAMRITGEGVWGEPDDIDNAKAVLRRVIELEVNFIDTADAYGPDVSENLIAEALHPYPDGVIIATKGGLTRSGPGQWHTKGTPEHLRQALDGSLRRLKLERIDLYQFHRPDPEVPFEDSIGELSRLRDEGKIRHIGLSNVTTEQLAAAQAIVPIVSVQNRYNIFDRESEDVLNACERENIGFIPWFPVGAGKLEEAKIKQIADKYNATPYQLALAWLLKRSPVMLPIPGTKSIAHLEENVAAAAIDLSDDDFNAMAEA